MNIVDQAAHVAASTWEMDKTYEDAMLTAFYQARGQEMREKKARESWESKSCAIGKSKQGWMRHLMQRLIHITTSMKSQKVMPS